MKRMKAFALTLVLLIATLSTTACDKTTLNSVAPYVEQSGRAVTMALADYKAAGVITEARFNELTELFRPFTSETKSIADYLRSLTTITADSKAEAFRRISEGVALGKRIALAAGLPLESTTSRVLTVAIIGLETTASSINDVKVSEASFSSIGTTATTEVPASSVKVKLPKVAGDLERYFKK